MSLPTAAAKDPRPALPARTNRTTHLPLADHPGHDAHGPPRPVLSDHPLAAPPPRLEGVVEAEAADVGVRADPLQPGQLADRHGAAARGGVGR